MNRRDRLDTLFGKRLRALARNLPPARDGDVKALHRTRVASRRVREALPLLDGRVPASKLQKVRRQTRRLTRVLGRVRELDVALQVLDAIKPPGPHDQIAADRVHEHLVRERERLSAEMLDRLQEIRPDKVMRRIGRQLLDEAPDTNRRSWEVTLTSRITTRKQRLAKAVSFAGLIYLPDRLHTVRIAVKKLRYALELANESALKSATGAIKQLKVTQDLLGRLHDVEGLMSQTRDVRAEVGADQAALAEALDRLIARLEEECRDLHAEYLVGRPALEEVSRRDRLDTKRRAWPHSSVPPSTAAESPRIQRRP